MVQEMVQDKLPLHKVLKAEHLKLSQGPCISTRKKINNMLKGQTLSESSLHLKQIDRCNLIIISGE